MKQIYDLCILGATAAALGFAETHPGLDIIILEEGMTPVREFSAQVLPDSGDKERLSRRAYRAQSRRRDDMAARRRPGRREKIQVA